MDSLHLNCIIIIMTSMHVYSLVVVLSLLSSLIDKHADYLRNDKHADYLRNDKHADYLRNNKHARRCFTVRST